MNAVDRPEVKLQFSGSKCLTNTELLSLVLQTGAKGRSAMDLAGSVLSYTDIGDLGVAEVRELTEIYGIGETKACSVVAAIELGKRIADERARRQFPQVKTPEEAAALIAGMIEDSNKEHFMALYLDTKTRVIARHVISTGTLDSTLVHPREVFRPAIKKGAASVIIAHNHPSSVLDASPDDISLTKRLMEASRLIGINLLDHLIIGGDCGKNYISLKEEGYIDN